MTQIVLYETDKALAASLSNLLQANGYHPTVLRDANAVPTTLLAAAIIGFIPPEKISLPAQIPVLACGHTHSEHASEILPLPLRFGHLLDRLDYHLRLHRATPVGQNFAGFKLDGAARKLHCPNGAVLELTDKEAAILQHMAAQPDALQSREQILAQVWGYNEKVDTHTLETHIYRLRRKLADAGERADLLLSEAGGYRLNV